HLFYQAMELALADNPSITGEMNACCIRLQIANREKQLTWRDEVKNIVDAARANNQSADDIRNLGDASANQLLGHFPKPSKRDLNAALLNALNDAIDGIDTEIDKTKGTREYLLLIKKSRTALNYQRMTWPDWITLSKKKPGAKSKAFAEPIADAAIAYDKHPVLHQDIRFFATKVFELAADSMDAYQQVKTQKGLIDFTDQEQRLYKLLDHPDVAETLREELQLLMVDEFQDTSPIQLALFLKLSQLAEQVIWVCDIKQSIYGFRGADPTLMSAVVKRVTDEGHPPQILKSSWRSRPELVAYTNNLFTPAFADTLSPEQVVLEPAREAISKEPAVELWRLEGKNKKLRAQALVTGVTSLKAPDKTVIDKASGQARPLMYRDIAILCRTHVNLEEIANALAEAKLPIRYKRPGLLSTPEGCLALACLRRLIDPRDTLASAEIQSLTTCQHPEEWIVDRINYLKQPDAQPYAWLEGDEDNVLSTLKAQRVRLPFLTPVETLRVAMDAGRVRESVYRWGPSQQRSQHRINNLSALLEHAQDYTEQCNAQNEPATAAGLVRWLQSLSQAKDDTQASGGDEDAIQLVTHHGAKGLEWPIVIAMDLDAKLKPNLWGLSVLASPDPVSLDDPLAGRTLRYWPKFTGQQSSSIPLLETIEESDAGLAAMNLAIAESKRLLYVSLTRPRDSLIITMGIKNDSGPWMDTLAADWMLPGGDVHTLPDATNIPSRCIELEASDPGIEGLAYEPTWLINSPGAEEKLPLRLSPSSFAPLELATIGETIELGERIEIKGKYDPTALGSAIHAVIATTLLGQDATERVLKDHQVQDNISPAMANQCTERLLTAITSNFSPIGYAVEYPIQYTIDTGQLVAGWIDILVETSEGFILIDHKASPRARSEWHDIALGYSGQLKAYADGITRATGKPVISQWVHFAVTGGMVEIKNG
ncbi:MAG: UvrD-helicase domain-containing protein, partial [Gammaproteobacteria bacterium]|nr:UvrD-helicase domain-containing protein [Gammaproteobacteria bacterium]